MTSSPGEYYNRWAKRQRENLRRQGVKLRNKLRGRGSGGYYHGWEKLPIDYIGTAKNISKLILSCAIPIALLYTTYTGIGNKIEYSTGTKIGIVTNLSKKGVVWKTYEGQMLENLATSDHWRFSIDSQSTHGENPEELAKQLQAYLESGQKVKITYIELLATWPWRSSTDYLIQTVEPSLEQILK